MDCSRLLECLFPSSLEEVDNYQAQGLQPTTSDMTEPLLRARISHKDSSTGEYGPLMAYQYSTEYESDVKGDLERNLSLLTTGTSSDLRSQKSSRRKRKENMTIHSILSSSEPDSSDLADNESENEDFFSVKRRSSNFMVRKKRNNLRSYITENPVVTEVFQLDGIPLNKGHVTKKVKEFEKTKAETFSDLFVLGNQVGVGSTAVVYRCRRRGKFGVASDLYAVKIINKSKLFQFNRKGNQSSLLDQFKIEIEILDKLRHKNIVRIYGMFETHKALHLVTEFAAGGEMFSFLLTQEGHKLKEDVAKIIMRQLMSAVACMHENGIIHRDLKLENILLSKPVKSLTDIEIKIVDFGLAKAKQQQKSKTMQTKSSITGKAKTFFGTMGYLAPEMFSMRVYDHAVDIWACGVIGYIIVCGQFPFTNETQIEMRQLKNKNLDNEVLSPKMRQRYRVKYPACVRKELTRSLKLFLQSLLEIQPKRRLSAQQALENTWMN